MCSPNGDQNSRRPHTSIRLRLKSWLWAVASTNNKKGGSSLFSSFKHAAHNASKEQSAKDFIHHRQLHSTSGTLDKHHSTAAMSEEDVTHRSSASRDLEVYRMDPSRYVQHLTQAWINERAAPDVLQYEQESVDGLVGKIEEQVL